MGSLARGCSAGLRASEIYTGASTVRILSMSLSIYPSIYVSIHLSIYKRQIYLALNPKPLNPKPLNPKPLNP